MISSTTRVSGPYAGTGLQTVFPFTFKVFQASDLLVVQTDNIGNVTNLTLTSQYTVTLNANQDTQPGGTVTLTTATPRGYQLTISSQVPVLQKTNLANAGNFYPTVINNALDYLTVLIQQLYTSMLGALRFPVGDPSSNVTLPSAASRANNMLGFDANGNPVAVAPAAQSATALQTLLATSSGAAQIRWEYASVDAILRTVEAGMRERVSVAGFGALGDGTIQYNAIRNAFLWCVANKKDMHIPAGVYSSGANNFPFKSPDFPAVSLFDCNGITIYGDGETTVLITESAAGADVLNLYSVKNLHIRNLAVAATLTGTAGSGSNGVSVVGGFDNVTVEKIWATNLPYVDKSSFLDGGKALTIQPGAPNTECGTFRAKDIFATGCVHGFGIEIDLPNWSTKRHSIDVEVTARDCYVGAVVSSAAPSSPLSASMTSGINIKVTAINCQRTVAVGRAHGIDLDARIVTTKSAANRRLNPLGAAWNSIDSTVDGCFAAYAKNSRISVSGDLGGCDYKIQVGGADAGSSGQGASSENSKYYFDIAGSSGVADINVIDYSGATIKTSEIYITASTATVVPAPLYLPSNGNMIAVGPSYRFNGPKIAGPLSFTEADGNATFVQVWKDNYGVSVTQTGSSSSSNLNFGVKTHTGAPAFSIRNDGGIATLGRATANSVATIKGVMPIFTQDNVLYGYVPIYASYA